jgi:hypothetical protein
VAFGNVSSSHIRDIEPIIWDRLGLGRAKHKCCYFPKPSVQYESGYKQPHQRPCTRRCYAWSILCWSGHRSLCSMESEKERRGIRARDSFSTIGSPISYRPSRNYNVFDPEISLTTRYGVGVEHLTSWALPFAGVGLIYFGLGAIPTITCTYGTISRWLMFKRLIVIFLWRSSPCFS